ncbi:MAG: hypothetical protein HY864_08735 [Chloroflexi bacterium]|nr:hypothetical protein [Chloroflexota bacterium]
MKITPAMFLKYSLDHPSIWHMMINQKIQHSLFGDGVIKEIRLGDNVLRNSSATIQFNKQIESDIRGLTDTIEIGLKGFNDLIITKLSVLNELAEKITEEFKS